MNAKRKPTKRLCKNCAHHEDVGTTWEGWEVGICHRYPPVITERPDGTPEAWHQPMVASDGDWCGEFKSKGYK